MAKSTSRQNLFLINESEGKRRELFDLHEHLELSFAGRRYRLVPIEDSGAREDIREPVKCRPIADLLSARELQIAALVADGLVNKQIGDRLGISEWTVSTHLRRIFAKLGVDTRAAMVSKCMGDSRHP